MRRASETSPAREFEPDVTPAKTQKSKTKINKEDKNGGKASDIKKISTTKIYEEDKKSEKGYINSIIS